MRLEEISSIESINDWICEYKKTENSKVKSQLKNLIVLSCLPLVKKISHSFARRNTDPIEDLIQVGSVGLLKSIEFFDINSGASFKTYATYLITGEIKHYLRDKVNMIRAPRELQELSFRVNQLIQKLTAKLNRAPTDLEIAQELSVSINRIAEVSEIDRRKYTISLDQIVSGNSEGEQSLADKLVDNKYQEFLAMRENRIMLAEAVENLDESLKDVIKLSFFEDMSQSQIAKILGISQMQVSRRIKKALSDLFVMITAKKNDNS